MLLLRQAYTAAACSICLGVTIAVLLVLAADLRYAAAPSETFGLAGTAFFNVTADLSVAARANQNAPIRPLWPAEAGLSPMLASSVRSPAPALSLLAPAFCEPLP
jgi:hypothetical protein